MVKRIKWGPDEGSRSALIRWGRYFDRGIYLYPLNALHLWWRRLRFRWKSKYLAIGPLTIRLGRLAFDWEQQLKRSTPKATDQPLCVVLLALTGAVTGIVVGIVALIVLTAPLGLPLICLLGLSLGIGLGKLGAGMISLFGGSSRPRH